MHQGTDRPVEIRKNRRLRRLVFWLAADLTVALVLIVLLFHTPAGYKPQRFGLDVSDPNRVDRYWTYLSSEVYNGTQTRMPFELIVLEEGINQAIAHSDWPKSSGEAVLYVPQARILPEQITVMGMVNLRGAELVITVLIKPTLTADGLLSLNMDTIKVGALNVTPLARMIARQMYAQRLEQAPVDADDLRARIAGALFNESPFDPVLDCEGRRVRVQEIRLDTGRMTLKFVPVQRPKR